MALFDEADQIRPMYFLGIQIDGFIGVVKRGEALISLSEFLSSNYMKDLRFSTVGMSYEFAPRFGVDILAQHPGLSKEKIALLTRLVAAYVDLGPGLRRCFYPYLQSRPEYLPDEKLSLMVARLSHIVSWRETYLSRNQDPPLLDRAHQWY
jgi:hypothetical protein